jgi:hypothetical protein
MCFALTSQQYVKIDAVAQRLPHAQRHPSLSSRLAGKLSLNARITRNGEVTDVLLAKLIDDAMRQVRSVTGQKQWQLLPERLDEDCVDMKELDILITGMFPKLPRQEREQP